MSSPVPACESVVNSIWRRMQQAWTVTAFRETRGASRRFRSAERGNATSPGLLIERVRSVAPAQLSVKARPVKSTLPALRSREGTRAPARLRSGLRHRSAVARERLALAQGVAASHGCEAGWDVHVDSLKSVAALSRNAAHQRLICQCHTRESADCCGISLRSSHKQARFARVCAPGPQRKLLEQCCNSRQKLRGALRILDGAYQAREGAQLQQVR